MRRARRPIGWHGPLVALLLVAALLLVVGYASASSGEGLDFPVDQLPLGVGLRNTYGIERNEVGPYVWTKPGSLLILPAPRPGLYRLTLTLQSPQAAGSRLVRIIANGQHVGSVIPDATPRAYTFDWARTSDAPLPAAQDVRVEMDVASFLPPGDERPLGIILTRVAFAPVSPAVAPLGALLSWLGLALGVLFAGALGGVRWRWRNAALAVAVAALLGVVAWDRALAQSIAALPSRYPWLAFNAVAVATLAALALGPFALRPAAVVAAASPALPNSLARRLPRRRLAATLTLVVPLVWAALVAVVALRQVAIAADALGVLSTLGPWRVESLQFAGVIFAYTLLGVGVVRAVKPALAVPTLIATFAVAVIALAIGAGALGTLALLLLLVAAWYELGRLVLLRLGAWPRERLEAWVVAFAVGSGLFALGVLLVGALGLLYPLTVALPVVALVASLLGRSLLALRAGWPLARRSPLVGLPLGRIPSWFETVLLGLIAGFAIIGFTAGLGPEVMSDAVRVHLVVARQFAAEHRVYGIADQRFSLWPIQGQMLYTTGTALGGTALAKLVHTATGFAVIAAVGVAGWRLGRSRTAGIVAAALFAGLPVAVWELGVGYTDLFVTLYGVTALLCLLRLLVSRDWRWALVLGLALGFGVAAKLTFGFLVVGTGLTLLVGFARRVPLRSLLPSAAALAAGLGLTAGLWLLRTAILTRELPGLSLLLGALGRSSGDLSSSVGNLSDFGTGRGVVPLLRLPWDLTLSSSRFGEHADGFVGFALLLLLPCLLALPRRRRTFVALAFVAVPFLLWFLTAQYTRYLLPVLAALATVLGVGVVWLYGRLGRWHPAGRFASRAHAAALSTILLTSLVFYFATYLANPGSLPIGVVLGREEPEAYLPYTVGAYEATRYLDRLVLPGDAVAALPDGPGLYTDARLITPFGADLALITAESIAALRATLDRHGITFLLINHPAVAPTWQNFWIVRPEFLDAYTDRVFTAGGATIYRLRPEQVTAGGEPLRDGGFATGAGQTSPWRPLGGASALDPVTNQGRSAVAVTGGAGYYQAVAVREGQGYRLRYSARSDQPGSVAAMRLDWFDDAGRLIASGTSAVSLTAEWADYTLWQPAPPGATVAAVYVLSGNGMPCWFADYSLTPAD